MQSACPGLMEALIHSLRQFHVPSILFASASPRRRQLLKLTGWEADWNPTQLDEEGVEADSVEDLPAALALAKAYAAEDHGDYDLVLAADTVVIDGDKILGKPKDDGDAYRMLQRLRGRTHRVITAVAIREIKTDRTLVEACQTEVPMRDYSDAEIEEYIRTGSPLDKAGAYGIQDRAFSPVEETALKGCFANVMGLPLCHLVRGMGALNYPVPKNSTAACELETGYYCQLSHSILRGDV